MALDAQAVSKLTLAEVGIKFDDPQENEAGRLVVMVTVTLIARPDLDPIIIECELPDAIITEVPDEEIVRLCRLAIEEEINDP